ncbi:ribokinase [Rhodoferax sp. BLA1]|uniref:ribokinase n=1 Tax=Rhodoferax sp. BLA1 TaxID=2576062 RepID=UPI0015D3EC2A|nr:ribokinase [Rhodoferax sp. BLA1]
MTGRIAVIGSNMVDLVTYTDRMPRKGETIEAPEFSMGFGGKGSNQAVAAARLGADVMMLTKVGDDMFGPNTRQNYINNGIDARYVDTVPGASSGVAPIFVDSSAENCIFIIKGANEQLLPSDVDKAAEDLKQCHLIVLQLEIPLETVYHAIEFGARHGIQTLLNPAPAALDLDLSQCLKASFLFPNETELATLSQMPTDTTTQVVAAARSLIAKGIKTVVVTLGKKGAMLVTQDHEEFIPGCDRVKALDTTGAGDAYIGSFAHFYVASGDLVSSLKKATLYAADAVTKPGTQKSYASADEFAAFCKRHGL